MLSEELQKLDSIRDICFSKIRIGGGNINMNIRYCSDGVARVPRTRPFWYKRNKNFILGERSIQYVCRQVEKWSEQYQERQTQLSDGQLQEVMSLEFK